MTRTWFSYFLHVKNRLKIDRRFFNDAIVVAKLYGHYKFGAGKPSSQTALTKPKIAFFPQPVGPWYNIWLVLQNTRLEIVKNIRKADYIFIFDDSTHSKAATKLPERIKTPLINHRVTDISKKNVGRVFEDVFGYGLTVDPTVYEGAVVEKSDENGTHDGRIIDGPISHDQVKADCTYQKFIDSSFSGESSEDLRVAAVYGHVAAVFHKHKAMDKRFSTEYLSTTVRDAVDVFSAFEVEKIARFCEVIGLDFGAIDVMRDKHDGLIYIVDVNKTCMPVMSLPFPEQYRSLSMIADVLEKNLPARFG